MIAEIRSSKAKLLAPNKLVYENIFDDVAADAVYEVSKRGVMQTIVIKEDLPPPSSFELSDETSRLEVITEFIDAPQPQRLDTILTGEADETKRQAMVNPDFTDSTLLFRDARIPAGIAFGVNLENGDANQLDSRPVGKHWQEMPGEGRSILFEAVEYAPIKEILGKLPDARPAGERQASSQRSIPAKRLASVFREPIQIAVADYKSRGLGLDWQVMLNPISSMTFASGQTYVISGPLNTASSIDIGNATFERGCIIKFPSQKSLKNHRVLLRSPGNFRKSPAFLTFLTRTTRLGGRNLSGQSNLLSRA